MQRFNKSEFHVVTFVLYYYVSTSKVNQLLLCSSFIHSSEVRFITPIRLYYNIVGGGLKLFEVNSLRRKRI